MKFDNLQEQYNVTNRIKAIMALSKKIEQKKGSGKEQELLAKNLVAHCEKLEAIITSNKEKKE